MYWMPKLHIMDHLTIRAEHYLTGGGGIRNQVAYYFYNHLIHKGKLLAGEGDLAYG